MRNPIVLALVLITIVLLALGLGTVAGFKPAVLTLASGALAGGILLTVFATRQVKGEIFTVADLLGRAHMVALRALDPRASEADEAAELLRTAAQNAAVQGDATWALAALQLANAAGLHHEVVDADFLSCRGKVEDLRWVLTRLEARILDPEGTQAGPAPGDGLNAEAEAKDEGVAA